MVTAAARYSSGPSCLGLGLADLALDGPGRHLFGVDVHLPADDLDQPPGVGIVVDGERALVAEAVPVGPEDAHAGRVEGGHPHPRRPGPDQLGHPRAHLVGRLVGEGDGQDLPGLGVAGGDQVGDPPGEHPGLARSGPGHDEQRAAPVDHRGPLGPGQPLDQLVHADRRDPHGPSAGPRPSVAVVPSPAPSQAVIPTRWCRGAWT